MEDIQVTDRAVFNDAPPEVLKRLAVNRQSNHFFFFFFSMHITATFV